MLLAAKRHQTFTGKSAALEFLDGVIATVQRATENWVQQNAPILKDAQTHEPLKKNPLAVLRTYMDCTGMSIDKIMEEVDWESFDDCGKVDEVFSINGTPWGETGNAEAEESE